MPDFPERHDNVAEIVKLCKNKFKWTWLEEKDEDGFFYSDYVRKLKVAGLAVSIMCHDNLKYGSRGKQSLRDHARAARHKFAQKTRKSMQQLPAMSHTTRKMIDG